MKVILSVAFLVGLLGHIDAEQGKEAVQIIDHPNKNEYTSVVVGSDKHKYGYELKENKHFHHTTTEEDGVRLGCYGYVLFGKKYSTQYVADSKGYRPVHTHDSITVYPKSGGERKASFVGDFNEEKERSENIRYFFPDGCKGIDVQVSPVALPMPSTVVKVLKNSNPPISPPKIASPSNIVELPFIPVETPILKIVPTIPTTRPTPPATIPSLPAIITLPRTKPTLPATKPTLPATQPTLPPTKPTLPPTKPALPPTKPTLPPMRPAPVPTIPSLVKTIVPNLPKENTCSKSCCSDDESAAKLILPIPMKKLGKSAGSCESFAKLIIPVEGLNPEMLRSLASGSDTTQLIKTILQSLA